MRVCLIGVCLAGCRMLWVGLDKVANVLNLVVMELLMEDGFRVARSLNVMQTVTFYNALVEV